MTAQWLYQVRFDLPDAAAAEAARRDLGDPVLAPLAAVLAKHRAIMKSQYDAFAEYVAAAEQEGVEKYPLYAWTKATIENPVKREKYQKSFTVYVEGQEVYAKNIADALAAELAPMAQSGLITRLKTYDTNPANNPQPPNRQANP
jgi:hypothetical protein